MADPDFSEIGAAFRHARLQLGWSQELFAEKAILSVGTIRAAESGSRLYPSTHMAMVEAINKARATSRPPLGALTLEYPMRGSIPENRAATPSSPPMSPKAGSPDLAVYLETQSEPSMAEEAPPFEPPVRDRTETVARGDPPKILWHDQEGLFSIGSDFQWRIKDACEGVVIFGATGSGKTSGSGQMIADAYLRAGFGGVVLCAKPDEPALWAHYASRCGRASDLVLFGKDSKWAFNFLEHESRRQGAGANLTENLVNLFTEIASIGAGSSGGSASDPFWERAMKSLVRNCIDLLVAAGIPVTLHHMFEVVRSAPTNLEMMQSEEWRQNSACWGYIEAGKKALAGRGSRIDFHEITAYWLDHFPTLGERTRSSIVAMFITLSEALMRSKMRELFCSGTTVAPEDVLAGKIVVIDLPVKEWGEVGRIAAVLWKYCFQKTVERRKDNPIGQDRPVFLWADECQYFISRHDSLYQATARSSRAATVYLTQSIPSLVAALGSESDGRALVDSLLNNLVTKIFHANSDTTTNEYASKLIGKEIKRFRNFSSSTGYGNSESWLPSITNSSGYSEQLDDAVHPNEFSRLKRGGPENGYMVTGMMIQMGRTFGAAKYRCIWIDISQRRYENVVAPPKISQKRGSGRPRLVALSRLALPWRHFPGKVSLLRWMAFVVVWVGLLHLGLFVGAVLGIFLRQLLV